jgi:hypothetical protein
VSPSDPEAPNPAGLPPSPSPLPPMPRANPFEPPPIGSYGGYSAQPRYAAPTSSEAIGALVCGIMASGCFPLAGVAIFLGVKARRAVRESGGQLGGEQLALAGMILGGVFGGLQLLIWLAYAAFFGFGIATGLFRK